MMPEDLPYIADSYSCIAVSYTVVVIVTSTLDSAVLLNWRGSSKSGEVATETRGYESLFGNAYAETQTQFWWEFLPHS